MSMAPSAPASPSPIDPTLDVSEAELTPAERKRLSDQFLRRRKQRIAPPTLEYITMCADQGRTLLAESHKDLQKLRATRNRETKTPEKLLMTYEHTERIFTGLTNTEINKVNATLTRNMPEVWIASDKGDDQQKFFETLIQELETRSIYGLIGPIFDSLLECGLAFWETYKREEIEDLDLEQYPEETPAEYRKRVQPLFRAAGRIVNVRALDPLSVVFAIRDEELLWVAICEDKPRPVVEQEYTDMKLREHYAARDSKARSEGIDPDTLPEEGDPGVPSFNGKGMASATGTVPTIRFFNRRWYAYIADGVFVEEPTEHGFPRIPISMATGIVTSHSRLANKFQGIVPGIAALNDAIDTQVTADNDASLTYGRAKFMEERSFPPPGSADAMEEDDGPPVDLRNPLEVIRPGRGSKFVNIYAGLDLNRNAQMEQRLRGYWTHATLNEVASGESPGASPAGYTVNALQTASLGPYGPFLRGFCRGMTDWAEMMREYYSSLGVPISIPAQESTKASERWIVVKPEQWDDTPIRVTMTPLSDQQKTAVAAELAQLTHDGIISRYTAARVNPMVADPEEEQLRMDLETVHPDLAQRVYQQTLIEVGLMQDPAVAAQQQQQHELAMAQAKAAGVGPPGGETGNAGADMPQPNPPSVGPEMAQASQGQGRQPVPESTQMAGNGAGGGGGPHALAGGESRP